MPKGKSSISDFFKRNRNFIIIGAFLLVIFYAFSFFLVKGGGLKGFDFDMTVRIQSKVPIRLDPYFSFLSLLGSFEPTALILAIILFLRKKILGILVFATFCFMHVVELVGKAFLDHPPTPFMFHRYALNFLFPTSYVQPGGSYPSGHAMRAAFLSILLIYIIGRTKLSKEMKIGISVLTIAAFLLMSISRISLGEHWTSDVIGGSILGSAFAFFSLIFI